MSERDLTDDVERRIGALLTAGDHAGAATCGIQEYGPQILGYLGAVLRDESAAGEAFSTFCEDLWKGLPSFRRESSFKTWAYKLAWHAAMRQLRDPFHRRGRALATDDAERLAVQVRSTTALHLQDASKDALAQIRAELDPEENTLLILRVDRQLAWSEIATVLAGDGEPPAEATLRKRFERLTEKLRRQAEARGLLPRG